MPLTLLPASILVLFGLALFVAGNLFDYPAIAVIGGVFVVAVGATIVTQGELTYRTGETETITNETANRTVVDHQPVYEPVETPTNFPLGYLMLLVGAVLSLQTLSDTAGG